MDRMITYRIRSSSLIEILVAITILMTVVVVGTVIFVNVTRSSFTGQKIRSQLLIDKLLRETSIKKSYFNEEFNQESILVKKSVTPYKGNKHLLLVDLKAYDQEQNLLAEKKGILLMEEFPK